MNCPTDDLLGRFRVRTGDTEIEYEGEDSQERYEAALDWIEDVHKQNTLSNIGNDSSAKTPKGKAAQSSSAGDQEQSRLRIKKGRGPAALARNKIKESLIPGGFFDSPKSNEEVAGELSRKGWPIPAKRVFDALLALIKEGSLDRFGSRGNYKYGKSSDVHSSEK